MVSFCAVKQFRIVIPHKTIAVRKSVLELRVRLYEIECYGVPPARKVAG
jgi:hypothetical protein